MIYNELTREWAVFVEETRLIRTYLSCTLKQARRLFDEECS